MKLRNYLPALLSIGTLLIGCERQKPTQNQDLLAIRRGLFPLLTELENVPRENLPLSYETERGTSTMEYIAPDHLFTLDEYTANGEERSLRLYIQNSGAVLEQKIEDTVFECSYDKNDIFQNGPKIRCDELVREMRILFENVFGRFKMEIKKSRKSRQMLLEKQKEEEKTRAMSSTWIEGCREKMKKFLEKHAEEHPEISLSPGDCTVSPREIGVALSCQPVSELQMILFCSPNHELVLRSTDDVSENRTSCLVQGDEFRPLSISPLFNEREVCDSTAKNLASLLRFRQIS